MFLSDNNSGNRVCDFQLVYDSDCKIMYDLYTYAQVSEPNLLGYVARTVILDCGLVSMSELDYQNMRDRMTDICQNKEMAFDLTKKMTKAINKTIDACILSEKTYVNNGCFNQRELFDSVKALVETMAYREIADMLAASAC